MGAALRRCLKTLGPGLISGAAEDDPSGITTSSIVGASFGFDLLWTAAASTPLMIGVQLVCARIGLVTGEGVIGRPAGSVLSGHWWGLARPGFLPGAGYNGTRICDADPGRIHAVAPAVRARARRESPDSTRHAAPVSAVGPRVTRGFDRIIRREYLTWESASRSQSTLRNRALDAVTRAVAFSSRSRRRTDQQE